MYDLFSHERSKSNCNQQCFALLCLPRAVPSLVSVRKQQFSYWRKKNNFQMGWGWCCYIVITTVVIYDNFLQHVRKIGRVNYDSSNNTDPFTMHYIVYRAP